METRDLVLGHVTQEALVIPCEYNRDDWSEQVTIQWYRYPSYRTLLVRVDGKEGDIDPETPGRASLGTGCSLVLSQPNVNDTGRYRVELRDYGNELHAQSAYVTVVVTDNAQGEKCWTGKLVRSRSEANLI